MEQKEAINKHFRGQYNKLYEKYLPGPIKKIGGKEFSTVCPFHDDQNPSFNFNADTGEYFCHGCGKKGGAFHFYAKLKDLDTRRDFPKILKGIAGDFGIPLEDNPARLVCSYNYTDIDGTLLFQVCRYEPKTFKQRRPDGNSNGVQKWSYDLNGTKRVLYRLPEIVKADEVLIVEGEKDADTVKRLGLTGTTSPMGAKKWRPEYSDYLKGKDVVLVPDNDNEGREHMAQVGAALKGIAKSIKWLDLPDLPSKGDVSDFVATFSSREEAAERLAVMIEGAKLYDAPVKRTIEDAVIDAGDYARIDLPPKRKILEIISEQEIILISGWRGTGKTWLGLSIVDAITRGGSFGPWAVVNSVPCLYLDGEMAATDIRARLNLLNPDPQRKAPLYVYSDSYANHLGLPKANLVSGEWRDTMKRILKTRKVKLWIIDNIASLAGGLDENSKKDWDPVNAWLLDLRFSGITTILLHHTNKAGGQRGTSGREDNIDMSVSLKQPPDYTPESGACFVLSFSKSRLTQDDLHLLQEMKFQLTLNDPGRVVWKWGSMKAEVRNEVLTMIDNGDSYREIADTLSISVGLVAKIKKQAIRDGKMNPPGRLI